MRTQPFQIVINKVLQFILCRIDAFRMILLFTKITFHFPSVISCVANTKQFIGTSPLTIFMAIANTTSNGIIIIIICNVIQFIGFNRNTISQHGNRMSTWIGNSLARFTTTIKPNGCNRIFLIQFMFVCLVFNIIIIGIIITIITIIIIIADIVVVLVIVGNKINTNRILSWCFNFGGCKTTYNIGEFDTCCIIRMCICHTIIKTMCNISGRHIICIRTHCQFYNIRSIKFRNYISGCNKVCH